MGTVEPVIGRWWRSAWARSLDVLTGVAFGSDAVAYVGEEFFTVQGDRGPATDWRRAHLHGDGHSLPPRFGSTRVRPRL